MKMTPALLIVGSLAVFWTSVFIAVFLPALTSEDPPSEIWRPWTELEAAGHRRYNDNGCSYCHSFYIRNQDWDLGAERIAEKGDYHDQRALILGTERIGPDLSQAGGEHPDDWHSAHFVNPRFTSPISLMPCWEFLGEPALAELTAFIQAAGGQAADERRARQQFWKERALAAWDRGPDANVEWLHSEVPRVWSAMPNPYPALTGDLLRGKVVYQAFCTGCHGPVGDGQGPAAPFLDPPPLNFTLLRRHLVEERYLGGLFYFQVMNGITGTAMPYFKRALESEKIWAVSNYIAVQFVGYTDATLEPRGIPAAYEPSWENPYAVPPAVRDLPPQPAPGAASAGEREGAP